MLQLLMVSAVLMNVYWTINSMKNVENSEQAVANIRQEMLAFEEKRDKA